MTDLLDSLIPEFRDKVVSLLANCRKEGFVMQPFYTRRSVEEQAKLWRQSRSTTEISKALSFLEKQGALYLSGVIKGVGPQTGRWATNALPGESWHQYGEAVDCFILDTDTGKAIWSSKHEGYRVYAEEAKKLGLIPGYFWQSQDSVHVQFRQEKVTKTWTWREIDQKMREQFS